MPDFATLWPSLADPAPVDSAWPSLSFTDEETKRVREKEAKALELKKRIDSDPWSVVKDKTALPGDKLMAAMAIQEKRINAPATAPALASAGGPMPGTMYGSLASARSDVAELATAPTSERGLAASMRFGNASRQEADPLYKPKKASIVGGWLAGAEAVDAKLSLDRINAGKADDMDYWRVASFLKQQEQKQDYTTGQTIFDGVLETGSFIGDIMATGGLSKIADKATKKLVTKTAEKYVTKGAAKLIGKGAGAGVGVAAQTALMPDKIAADAGMRYYQGDDALTAIAKGTASTAIDVGTERMGGLFAKRYLPKALRKAVWVNPRSALGKSGAFQGPGEMLEESYSDVAKGATGLAPDFGATGQAMVGNFRPLAETAAVVGLTSGLGAAPNLARDSQKPLKFDTTQKLPTAAEVNEAMMQPETAQAWATANPEAAARMATIDSPSRSQWEELTGEKMRGNPASRKAFADNVRATLSAEIKPDLSATSAAFKPDVVGQDSRWHYGTTPWKPEPSPESIADTVGTTPIAADPTPGARQSDVLPVEQVTEFSTPKVDYNLKDAPKPQDSQPIEWRTDNSGFDYAHRRGDRREVTVKQGNPFAASIGEGAKWQVLVDSDEYGPDFATHAEAKAYAEKVLRHRLMPFDHPAKLLNELSYMRQTEMGVASSDIISKLVGAGVPRSAVIAIMANGNGIPDSEVDAMIEKYMDTDTQGEWARENLPRWMLNRILNDHQVNDFAERIDNALLDHPAAWDWTWEQLQSIKSEVRHAGTRQGGTGATAEDTTMERLRDLADQLEAFAAKDEADPIRLQQSHEYSPITPEQRAPAAPVPSETANALNPPVSDKTPQPAPKQPPAQEAVAAEPRGEDFKLIEPQPSMVQSPSAMGITPPGVQIKLGGIGSWLAKWFKSAGHLPDSAYARKTLKDADVASEEKSVRNNANDLRDALRAELGTSKLLPSGQKKIDAALKGDAASLTGFSPRVQKAITAMRKHIDALSERLIASGVLDEQLTITVDENMGSYVTRSYQAHDDQSYKPSEKVRNDAFAHLQAAFPNENAQQINNRLDDMLAKAKEGAPVAAVKRSMLGAKDRGILTARKDIAPEIRAFLGEYNDPFVNYAKSATKMASLISNQEFLNDVKVAGQGKFFFDRDDPNRPTGYNVEFAAEGSEALSPLNGLMTTPEIKQAFADINPQHITDGWLRTLLGANYVVKYSKTVLSPMTHQRNLTGNVMFAVQNGHWNVPMMATAAKATGGELAASLPETGRALVSRFAGDGKAWREAFQRYTKLGIVGDGIHSGELKAALRDVTDTTKAAVEAGMFGYAVKGLRGGAEMATTLYQLEDAIWKIYAFENERARYKSAYEKAGQPKSDAELDAMSASVVSDTYPTYSKLPRAITALRRIPFIGSFVSFPAEVIRTGVMSIKLGVKEFNDPALKSIGAQRLAGNLVAIAATTALGAASQWLFDIDDEEEEALRKFLPPWQENAEILWLSKPKDGKAMYIDLSYTMPHSMLKEPYTAAMRGDDVYDSLKKGTFQFAEPFISEEILAGKLYDIARNTKGGESRSEVYPTYGTDAEKAAAITNHLYGAFEPGGMTSARRIMAGVTGAGGKVYNPYTEAAAVATGQRIQETDVAQSLKFDAKNYRNAERKTTSMFSAPFQREGKVSDEQIAKSYNSATTAASAQFEKLHQAAVSAKKLGVSEDEIRSILAANGVSKTRHDDPDSDDPTVKLPSEIDRVLAGKYEPYRISRNLYDHVSEMPGGKERLAAYEKASGDKESVAELHRIDVTNAANALSREKPDKPGDTDADRQKWFADRQEAIQWLRAKGVSGQDVLTTYLPELRKIKTDTTRAEKRDRLKAALRGL